MDLIFEFIVELILDGTIELCKSRKVPKFIRYPLIILMALFFAAVICIIILTGIAALQGYLILGIILILFGLLMLVMAVIKFRKIYLSKKKQK